MLQYKPGRQEAAYIPVIINWNLDAAFQASHCGDRPPSSKQVVSVWKLGSKALAWKQPQGRPLPKAPPKLSRAWLTKWVFSNAMSRERASNQISGGPELWKSCMQGKSMTPHKGTLFLPAIHLSQAWTLEWAFSDGMAPFQRPQACLYVASGTTEIQGHNQVCWTRHVGIMNNRRKLWLCPKIGPSPPCPPLAMR